MSAYRIIAVASIFTVYVVAIQAQPAAEITPAPPPTPAKGQTESIKGSKDVSKMTKEQKEAFANDATRMNINPNGSTAPVGDFPPYGPRKPRPYVGAPDIQR